MKKIRNHNVPMNAFYVLYNTNEKILSIGACLFRPAIGAEVHPSTHNTSTRLTLRFDSIKDCPLTNITPDELRALTEPKHRYHKHVKPIILLKDIKGSIFMTVQAISFRPSLQILYNMPFGLGDSPNSWVDAAEKEEKAHSLHGL